MSYRPLEPMAPKICERWASQELYQHLGQLVGLWLVFFVTAGLTYHAPPVMLRSIMLDFKADAYHIAWLGAIFQLCKGIFTLPGGYALHRYGCRRCFRAGGLVILMASLLYPIAPSLWWLALLHGIYGSAYDLIGVGPVIVFATRLASRLAEAFWGSSRLFQA